MNDDEQIRIRNVYAELLSFDLNGWFECEQVPNDLVNVDYCESFDHGKGCKFLKDCLQYNYWKGKKGGCRG